MWEKFFSFTLLGYFFLQASFDQKCYIHPKKIPPTVYTWNLKFLNYLKLNIEMEKKYTNEVSCFFLGGQNSYSSNFVFLICLGLLKLFYNCQTQYPSIEPIKFYLKKICGHVHYLIDWILCSHFVMFWMTCFSLQQGRLFYDNWPLKYNIF